MDAEAVTNAEGTAIFNVTGELPGSTEIEFLVEGTLIRQSVRVNVALPNQEVATKADKPTANLTSGEVAKGTLLTLATTTPGAAIYYTTDGSCPCAEGGPRVLYTGPIEINEDVIILAAAYKEGMDYSDTLGLFFTVKQQGVTLSGMVKTYSANKSSTTIALMQGEMEIRKITIEASPVSGQTEQLFTIQGVVPGTYSLVITKPGHTSFTVQSIIVGNENLDLTKDSRPEVLLMTLRCGDLNGDGIIDDRDLTILWLSSNYYKNTAQASNPLCDLNGDGVIDDRDLTILWMANNYYRGEIIIQYWTL
ncbi:MAG: chitobiase/beta-hexosaminidase C-terminal domain-containing protein [Oscillospiraceae bacterium]|nr:chitobiase/beta-hexosaminidase C-terminal domain-containing protein [Oscillospiraceae bacterium]